jgi:hypothetical protein
MHCKWSSNFNVLAFWSVGGEVKNRRSKVPRALFSVVTLSEIRKEKGCKLLLARHLPLGTAIYTIRGGGKTAQLTSAITYK